MDSKKSDKVTLSNAFIYAIINPAAHCSPYLPFVSESQCPAFGATDLLVAARVPTLTPNAPAPEFDGAAAGRSEFYEATKCFDVLGSKPRARLAKIWITMIGALGVGLGAPDLALSAEVRSSEENRPAVGMAFFPSPPIQSLDVPANMPAEDEDVAHVSKVETIKNTIRFSAKGLPVGFSINPETGIISGVFDRKANRNSGPDYVITVRFQDGRGGMGQSVVQLKIENAPPIVGDDFISTAPNEQVKIPILENDHDPDGDLLSLIDVKAKHGTVAYTPDGFAIYLPHAGWLGIDSVKYTVGDGRGAYSEAMIFVTTK
jgi:hypothetical protein